MVGDPAPLCSGGGSVFLGNGGGDEGGRHAALFALDSIGTDNAKDALATVLESARGGDMRAAEILLRRLWPERKGRPVSFDLPALETAADVAGWSTPAD